MRVTIMALGWAVLLAGCDAATLSDAVQRTEVGDTLIVFSAAPVHSDTIRAREVMRWGALSGDPDLLFSDIYAFSPTLDGGIIVHDDGEGIRRFDAEGNFVERVARTGEGPGEVQSVRALAQGPDGRIAAFDLGNARISVYQGGDVRSIPRPGGMPRYGGDAVFFGEDASLWLAVSPPFPESGGVTHPRPVYARFDASGSLQDTVFTPERIALDCPALSSREYQRGFWEDVRAPFLPKVKWSLTPDGSLLVGCPSAYEFEVVALDGSVRRIGRTWEPVRTSDDHRALLAERVGTGPLPEDRPAYVRLQAMSEGRIWVRPTLPSHRVALPDEVVEQVGITHTWDESTRAVFDVFSVEEGWIGTVALPPAARYSGFPTEPPVVIRGDSIWATATDSLDVQYLVKYVIDWPEG